MIIKTIYIGFIIYRYVCAYSVTKSCLTLCDPVDHSLPSSSVYGIFQARILEWAAISSSRESSQPRDQTHISYIGRQILYHWATREAQNSTKEGKIQLYRNKVSTSYWNLLFSCILTSVPIYLIHHTSRHPGMWSQVGLRKHHYEQS